MHNPMNQSAIPGVSLNAAGLVALADLISIAQRTALTGTASYLDILFIAPGIHRQQTASALNGGELPATGALTTGYVFRIENQATVSYMQRVGRAGHLVNLVVLPLDQRTGSITQFFTTGGIASYLYLLGPALTLLIIVFLSFVGDWWGVSAIGMLILARLLNVIVIKRRSVLGWKGAPEPGVRGDLLVLLNQDRWIRIRGLVDDLKTVTSGQWLRDETMVEGFMSSTATLLVFMTAGLAGNASPIGCLLLACLLLTSAGLLGLCNSLTKKLQMFGRVVQTSGEPVAYRRRLDLAEELIKESGRDDWAIGLGMITVKGMKPATM
ncbi:hypothetical protein FRC17_003105 [Serendipita sp. 399]|nr:hypothetical protein FRC17_003105 [Serendipita sp. 399]